MLGKESTYVINKKNIQKANIELAGEYAIEQTIINRTNYKSPESFVITSLAFDDFLIANNLVDPILRALKKVKPFIRQTAEEASGVITNYIMSAEIPTIIQMPILEAYRNMSANRKDVLVKTYPSNIIDPKYAEKDQGKFWTNDVYGQESLIGNIKKAWLALFSTEAIEIRANNYYSQELTIAVGVKRIVKSEISGTVYSTLSKEKNFMEIQTIYGIDENLNRQKESFSDIYKINKKNFEITQKQIIPQMEMIVQKGKPNEKGEVIEKVNISPSWQKKQKLEDKRIQEISKISLDLEKGAKSPLEISFGYEMGEILVLNITPIEIVKGEKKKDLKVNDWIELADSKIEKLKKAKLNTSLGKEDKRKKPNFKSLAKEIEETIITKDKATEDITEEYEEELTFFDISKLDSASLVSVSKYDGGFLDATEIILDNGILPEEVNDNPAKMKNAMESAILDIELAIKSLENNPLIFQFSSITNRERGILNIPEDKYYYDTDERFIENPGALTLEFLALKKAQKNTEQEKIAFCIPGIRTYANLKSIEKILKNQKFTRNSDQNLFVEISIPGFVFDLEKVKEDELDGVVVNYKKLLQNLVNRDSLRTKDHLTGLEVLKNIQRITKDKKFKFIVRINDINEEVKAEIEDLSPGIVIVN